jgi:hypothetical protein
MDKREEICKINPNGYEEHFGEDPQVGHFIVDGEWAGPVIEVLNDFTIRVAWQRRKRRQKRTNRTPQRVTTYKRHGIGWLVAQDAMDARNAAYQEAAQ